MHPSCRRRRRTTRRLQTAAVAALALPLTMLANNSTLAQVPGVQYSVDYKTNDWDSGFTTDLTLTNRSTDPINGWTLTYDHTGNQTLTSGWNGTWSQSGRTVTAKNASWNGTTATEPRSPPARSSPTAAPTRRPPPSQSTAPPAPAPISRRSPC